MDGGKRKMKNSLVSKLCPRCQTVIKVFTLPEGTMTDPAPARSRMFVVKCCPNCGKRVVFWVGRKQVVE